MPIFQPVYMTPSNNETVDVTKDIEISCVIRSNCKAYRFFIFNNSTNASVCALSKVTLPSTLYNNDILAFILPHASNGMISGNDYRWLLWVYNNQITTGSSTATGITSTTITLASSDTKPDDFYKNYYIEYGSPTQTKKITAYNSTTKVATLESAWSSTPPSGDTYSIVEMVISHDVYIKARANPVVSLDVPTVLTQNTYTFQGHYSQAENASVSSYKITVYDSNYSSANSDNSSAIIQEFEEYSEKMSFTVDGFLSGQTYYAGLTVTDSNDVTTVIDPISFTVSYTIPIMASNIEVTPMPTISANLVNWQNFVEIDGIPSSNDGYFYLDNCFATNESGIRIFDSDVDCDTLNAYDYTCDQWNTPDLSCIEIANYRVYR